MIKREEIKPYKPEYKHLYIKSSTSPNDKYTSARIGEDDYLQTGVWAELRERRLRKDRYICQHCGSAVNVEVHHIRYPEVWGEEDMKDLVTLCDKCHEQIHSAKRIKNTVNVDIWEDF